MSKLSMEACPKINYELVVKKERKKGKDTSFNIMIQKDQKFRRKFDFYIPKFKFQICWAILKQTSLCEPNPR